MGHSPVGDLTLLEETCCSLSSSLSVLSDSVGEGGGETAPHGEDALLPEGEKVLPICRSDSTATEVSLSRATWRREAVGVHSSIYGATKRYAKGTRDANAKVKQSAQ